MADAVLKKSRDEMKMTSFILLRPQIQTTRLNNLREKLSSPERTDHIQGICVDLYNVFPGPREAFVFMT